MRNKDKTKATFFPKLSFTASFPSLPPWRAQRDGGHYQFITLYFCHSPLFIHLSCPTAYSSSQTAPVYPQGTLLKQQTDPPWVPPELQLLPQNQLLCRLLSTGCSFSQEPAPQGTLHELQLSSRQIHFLSHGILHGLQGGSAPCGSPWAQDGQCAQPSLAAGKSLLPCLAHLLPLPSSLILVSLEGLLLSCFSSLLPSLSQLLHCIF